jgi:prepilin-type N-terminal cleavage/methylation domain-containing protein
MQRRKNAFTLIELLVVIAIIAILAAILFPVFAQAKQAAKKTATISNAKQTGTAMMIYVSDADDLFPCGTVPDLSSPIQRYRSSANAVLTPAGWNGNAALRAEHELVWANTIQPYMKNYDMLDMTGSRTIAPAASIGNPATANPRAQGVNFAFNGLLQYYSTTAVDQVSRLTLLWQGMGDETTTGLAYLTPRLRCDGTGPCTYNAGGQPQADSTAGFPQQFTLTLTAKFHTFGQGNVHVFADSSAKMVQYGNGNRAGFPLSTRSQIPYQFFTSEGRIPSASQWAFRGMGPLRGANYAAAFCPDNNFSN